MGKSKSDSVFSNQGKSILFVYLGAGVVILTYYVLSTGNANQVYQNWQTLLPAFDVKALIAFVLSLPFFIGSVVTYDWKDDTIYRFKFERYRPGHQPILAPGVSIIIIIMLLLVAIKSDLLSQASRLRPMPTTYHVNN